MLSSKEIRSSFIDFFRSKEHQFVHSSPVVPEADPTLLFTNAGMNQFKDIFLGLRERDFPRVVNSQKCIRAGGKHNDLEEVGQDGYHHTFFEMLGNWSFADYYKKEAIAWAWELLTEVWKLPKDKLYATVHDSDQEAYDIWKSETDINPAHISFHGDEDNFWEMGETGPCGPCSEIHIDRGEGTCDRAHDPEHVCGVNTNCARYIELWNLVFIQYKREADRSLTPLKDRFVDTGAGLERVAQVLQDKHSNYETDLFMPIIEKLAQLSGKAYDIKTGVSHRVIADHVRCLCFALADGGFPSNEGRGYVLRRILRRAARHGRLLGFTEPFLYLLVNTVVEIMGHHFTELKGKEDYIRTIIKAEEERFNHTLDIGLQRFEEIVGKLEGKTIAGKDAFMLYDTYGFPLDLTQIMAAEHGLDVDLPGFEAEMEAQRERARSSSKFSYSAEDVEWITLHEPSPTEFVGYTQNEAKVRIQSYYFDEEGYIHLRLDKTPFYAESGGQVADTGVIFDADFEVQISDVQKHADYYIHTGKVLKGTPHTGELTAKIDAERRLDIARNHTLTHLIHKALKELLGDHVQQKGSLVAPDYARFDFTHQAALDKAQLHTLEKTVNEVILQNREVSTEVLPIEEAKKQGAIALFGEKYADDVRVVSVEGYSKELCGGTHVQATGQIGLSKIISESSSAAGIRRLEVLSGRAAMEHINHLQERLHDLANKLKSPEKQLEDKLDALIQKNKDLEEELKAQAAKHGRDQLGGIMQQAEQLDGFRFLAAEVQAESADQLRAMGDDIKSQAADMIAFLFAAGADKVSILCVVGSELKDRFHAGKLIGQVAAVLGGKGGGRPDSAMAGGRDASMIPQAIDKARSLVSQA